MNKGLSNFQIDDFFKDEANEDVKKNYVGTYSIDSITKYINFHEIIKRKNAKYPFAIFNTDKENKPGVIGGVLWTFIQKIVFFFYLFGLEGFKLFIVNNDQQIIKQLLYNFNKCQSKANQKLQLCMMKFCVESW